MSPSVQVGASALLSALGGAGASASGGLLTACTIFAPFVGGTGGAGRIKILYGDTYDNQGTLADDAGARSISWMPPVSITSSTQPSQTAWYNDGISAPLSFSWEKPFTGAYAYYYSFSANPALQLTPSNGTATVTPAATVPATAVAGGGTYYLWALTVNTSVVASTVANRFAVQINSAPHTLSSPSHPNPNAWYQGALATTVSMAWAPPAGISAGNFQGYYYRVDHVSDTAPPALPGPATGWTLTPATSVVTQQDDQGNALQNGTYYFHLVAVDSVGNATRVAASYQIQIGPQPAQTKLFGYVTALVGGTPLSGVSVTLQPYGLSTTTDASGYYLFPAVNEETYTLTAVDTGHATVQQSLAVTPAVSPYNFTM